MLRKLVKNNLMAFILVIPNLGIGLVAQTVLRPWIPWQFAYLIGAGLGFEWGVLFAMFTRSNFKVGKWRYNYSTKANGVEKE